MNINTTVYVRLSPHDAQLTSSVLLDLLPHLAGLDKNYLTPEQYQALERLSKAITAGINR